MACKVLAIANQKGGVGKTTTAVALASGMIKRGVKTLLIDLDNQINATDSYKAQVAGVATLYDLLFENEDIHECIQKCDSGDIIAGDTLLKEAEQKLPNDGSRFFILREKCEELRDSGEYDYIILDCPPTIGALLNSALTFADEVVVPVSCDRYALQGLTLLNDTIRSAKKYTNPNLKIMGLLLTKHSARLNITKEVEDNISDVAAMMNTKVFTTRIRECVSVRMAQAQQTSIWDYDATSNICMDYYDLIEEILCEREEK